MKLNLEQIRSITLGAELVEETEKGFCFHRFTKEQEELYAPRPALHAKTFCTSGIKFRFRTTGTTLGIKGSLGSGGSTRTFYSFDLFLNGERKDTLDNFSHCPEPFHISNPYSKEDFSKAFELGEGEKEVLLYFPWSLPAVLSEVTLDDGATILPVKPAGKMLCFGDSITQGYDAAYPSNSYVSLLARDLQLEEYNKAIGAEVFFPPLADSAEPFVPTMITVAYGTNDWSKRSFAEFERDCKAFYENLSRRYPSTPIFAITPIWRNTEGVVREFGEFSVVAETIARIVAPLPNVCLIFGKDFVPADSSYFSDLRLHPNDKGFAAYHKGLYKAIVKALNS